MIGFNKLLGFIKKSRHKNHEVSTKFQSESSSIDIGSDNNFKRPYKNIPLYTEDEMKMARVDNSEEVLYEYVGRQALNGYVSLYEGEWVVGKYKNGEIVKTNKDLLFECSQEDKKRRNKRIEYTQKHAVYGCDIYNEVFCKFTYDIEHQDDFSTHVKLMKEYIESEIMEDVGTYGGIHFVPLEHIGICLDSRNTYYGDKVVLIKTLENEVYYEYMDNVFVGNKVFVEKVMKLSDVDTWKILSGMTNSIAQNREKICKYLYALQIEKGYENYEGCIEYIHNL